MATTWNHRTIILTAILVCVFTLPAFAGIGDNCPDPDCGFNEGGNNGGNNGGGAVVDPNDGQFFASGGRLIVENTGLQLRLLSRRIRGPASISNSGIVSNWESLPERATSLYAHTQGADDSMVVRGQYDNSTHNAWGLGYGLGGEVQLDGSAPGVNYALGGSQFGFEKALSDCVSVGGFAGLAKSQIRQDVDPTSTDIDHLLLGAYLHKYDGLHYYVLSGLYGYDDITSDRITGSGTARGQYHGHQAATYLERGLSFCWNGFQIQPMGALQYIFVRQSNFSETGAGNNNLSVDAVETHSFRGILGGRTYWQRDTNLGLWAPDVHAQWIHEFLETSSGVLVGTAPATSVRGVDPGRDFALVGVGTTLVRSDRLRLYAAYDVQMNAREVLHLGTAGFDWSW